MNEFSVLMNTLETALSLKRGHGSETEAKFVAWLIKQVTPTMIDGAGNIHIELGTSRTMFTSHTDSVHHHEGANGIRKTETHWYGDKDALGADDGCGIAIMLHMIAAGVPGRYVFFRGEECGGIGSSWLAAEMPELLARYDRAIAFDRAGLGDVITFQAGGRCCSDAFADALADGMNQDGLMYLPDATGVFTDTANFIKLIPECTNLSVGYDHQHGPKEELNLRHFLAVAAVAVKIDWEALPTVRDPKVRESRYSIGGLAGAWPTYVPTQGDLDDLPLDADSDSGDEIEALNAIEAALYDDDYRALIDIMANSVYPEDPELVKRLIRRQDFTQEMLEEACDEISFYTVDSTMLRLYDQLPVPA